MLPVHGADLTRALVQRASSSVIAPGAAFLVMQAEG
jgi:hypothetical protein